MNQRIDRRFFGLMESTVRNILDSLEIRQKYGWDLGHVGGEMDCKGELIIQVS